MSAQNKLDHGLPTDPVDRTFVIGISGDASSGKTTLAKKLATFYAEDQTVDVHVISQSDFFLDYSTAPAPDSSHFTAVNSVEEEFRDIWNPSRISPEFWDIVFAISRGRDYEKAPIVHQTNGTKTHFDRVIIVEGPYLFHDGSPLLRDGCFDLKLYIQPQTLKLALFRNAQRFSHRTSDYWLTKRFVEKVAWPSHRRAHAALLAGKYMGIEIEAEARNADATARWGYCHAQKYMNEQKDMWAGIS